MAKELQINNFILKVWKFQQKNTNTNCPRLKKVFQDTKRKFKAFKTNLIRIVISDNQTTNLSTESASLLSTESSSNNATLRPKKQLKAKTYYPQFITCRTANRGQNNPKNQDYFAWKKLPFVLSNLHYIFLIFIRFLWKSPDSAGSVILHEEVQQPLLVIIIKLFQFFVVQL